MIINRIVEVINDEFLPTIKKQVLGGESIVITENKYDIDSYVVHFQRIFSDPLAVDIVLDILSERGYNIRFHQSKSFVPKSVDLTTGDIKSDLEILYIFKVSFKRPVLRLDTL